MGLRTTQKRRKHKGGKPIFIYFSYILRLQKQSSFAPTQILILYSSNVTQHCRWSYFELVCAPTSHFPRYNTNNIILRLHPTLSKFSSFIGETLCTLCNSQQLRLLLVPRCLNYTVGAVIQLWKICIEKQDMPKNNNNILKDSCDVVKEKKQRKLSLKIIMSHWSYAIFVLGHG